MYMRRLSFPLGMVFLFTYILLFLYAIKFFVYASDSKLYSYFLYSKVHDRKAEELKQLVNDYPITIYRISLFGLTGFLFVSSITLLLFRKNITPAIIAVVVTSCLIYLDLLKMRRPEFFEVLPSSWFSNIKTYLVIN